MRQVSADGDVPADSQAAIRSRALANGKVHTRATGVGIESAVSE